MDNKKNEEESLLLKYPINFFSNSLSNDNLLMPVGRQDTNDVSEATLKSPDSPDPGESRIPSAICQLEQPLLFRETSQPSQTNVAQVSFAAGTTISSVSQPLENTKTENQLIYSQTISHHEPFFSSYSNPSSQVNQTYSSDNIISAELYYASGDHADTLSQTTEFPAASETFQFQSIHDVDKTGLCQPGRSVEPVKPYWFFSDIIESKEIWYGFCEKDSQKLEEAYLLGLDSAVPTDGGRCDVYLNQRIKKFVYFDSKELHVRRCTWFQQQGSSLRFKPYDENTSACLEEFYLKWVTSGAQDMRFVIPGIVGSFLFEKPFVMLHFGMDANTWTAPNELKGSPNIVKRCLPKSAFQFMPDESPKIDHLLFIVQGIGSFCDLRFRTVAECVDGFRDIANKLIDSHFRKEVEQGFVGRVEILPVAWHAKLRTSDIGLDRTMKMITLPSIPKLRHFTNDTLIDILLYSSPSYCQSIVDTVAQELNNVYKVFTARNPEFCGKVFVAGHSLGSLILFDILSSQSSVDCNEVKTKPESTTENFENVQQNLEGNSNLEQLLNNLQNIEGYSNLEQLLKALNLEEYLETFKRKNIDLSTLLSLSDEHLKNIDLPAGLRQKLLMALHLKEKHTKPEETESAVSDKKHGEFGDSENKIHDCHNRMVFPLQNPNAGDSAVIFPRLLFHPAAFFAMGSPISMFLAIRGFDTISEKFKFPTCPAFFHIFHPYDPVAFRIEPMIDHSFTKKPALIPHHKGRKRMHLEIKENVSKFANELRQRVMYTLHRTWLSFNEFTGLQPYTQAALEHEVNSIVPQDIPEIPTYGETTVQDTPIGNLNGGRRIDYVLQEKPLEALNDYVWALTSHATYWDSEDTVLMILREIYAIQGINVPSHIESYNSDSILESGPSAQDLDLLLLQKHMENMYPSGIHRKDSIHSFTSSDLANVASSSNYSLSASSNVAPTFEGANYCVSSSNGPPLNVNYTAPLPEPTAPVMPAQPLGPPPLTGFVKRSAFSKNL